MAPARVRRNRAACRARRLARRRRSAACSASSLPSSTGPSLPTRVDDPAEQPQRDFVGQIRETLGDRTPPAFVRPRRRAQRAAAPRSTARSIARPRPARRARASAASRSRRQPLGGKQRHQLAQARPGEARVAVRRVVREGDLRGREGRDQAGLGNGEQRADQMTRSPPAPARRPPRHPAQARQPAAPRQPEQHRLGLIVERVRGEDVPRAGLARRLAEQPIARVARRLLDAGLRLPAGPAQRAVLDLERSWRASSRQAPRAPTPCASRDRP